jgi:hypothetical protein
MCSLLFVLVAGLFLPTPSLLYIATNTAIINANMRANTYVTTVLSLSWINYLYASYPRQLRGLSLSSVGGLHASYPRQSQVIMQQDPLKFGRAVSR